MTVSFNPSTQPATNSALTGGIARGLIGTGGFRTVTSPLMHPSDIGGASVSSFTGSKSTITLEPSSLTGVNRIEGPKTGLFGRIWNIIKGALGFKMTKYEQEHPEAVYEAGIDARTQRFLGFKKAAAGVFLLRNQAQATLDTNTAELAEIETQIPVALEEGDDAVTLVLIQKKNELEKAIVEAGANLDKYKGEVESVKETLITLEAQVHDLRSEKDQMLAKKAMAEARISIQEAMDSALSPNASEQAVAKAREGILKKEAEAAVGDELKGTSLDARLGAIKEKAKDRAALSQLDEMKKQMAARKAQAEGTARQV